MNNKQVAEAFANGDTTGHSNNMFIERVRDSVVIYSYGYHFPLAVKTSEFFAFVNFDKYSNTTTRHAYWVREALATAGIETEYKTTQELKTIIRDGLID